MIAFFDQNCNLFCWYDETKNFFFSTDLNVIAFNDSNNIFSYEDNLPQWLGCLIDNECLTDVTGKVIAFSSNGTPRSIIPPFRPLSPLKPLRPLPPLPPLQPLPPLLPLAPLGGWSPLAYKDWLNQ